MALTNTNGGWSVIVNHERQADAIVRAIRRLRRQPGAFIDTRPSAAKWFDRYVQLRLATRLSALQSGCSNYYVANSGKNVTQWPGTHTSYMLMTRLLTPFAWVIRSKSRPLSGPPDTAIGTGSSDHSDFSDALP